MLLSCIAWCCTALWSLLQCTDRHFHLFIFSHGRSILNCNLHKKCYSSLLPSLCSPPTHIYRHAATNGLNLDSTVAKLCLITLLLFYHAMALIQLFSSLLVFSPSPLQLFHIKRVPAGGGQGYSAGYVPEHGFKKTKIDLPWQSLVKHWVTVR